MMHVLPPIGELWCINPNSLTLHMVDGKGGGGEWLGEGLVGVVLQVCSQWNFIAGHSQFNHTHVMHMYVNSL